MDTKTIEQVSEFKAMLFHYCVEGGKMIWHVFQGRAGDDWDRLLYAGSAGAAILGGDSMPEFAKKRGCTMNSSMSQF